MRRWRTDEKMRGDTTREMRKDKDIKRERIYEMRTEEKQTGEESLWPVVNPCFTDLAVTWQLRPAYCQDQASSLLFLPSIFI